MKNRNIEKISRKVLGDFPAAPTVVRFSKMALIFFIAILTTFILVFIFIFDHRNGESPIVDHGDAVSQHISPQTQELWYEKKLSTLLMPEVNAHDEASIDYAKRYPGSDNDFSESKQHGDAEESSADQEADAFSINADELLMQKASLPHRNETVQARLAPLASTAMKPISSFSLEKKAENNELPLLNNSALYNSTHDILENHVEHDQSEKLNFLKHMSGGEDSKILLPDQARDSALKLNAGTIIPAILITEINSDLPGIALAQVRQPIYDSRNGITKIISAGAKILLNYDSKVVYGQKRILLTAMRLIFPDGRNFSLHQMPVVDMSGQSGFHDQVDPHYTKIFSSAMALGVISAGLQLGQPQRETSLQTLSSGQVVAGAVTQNFGEVASQTISKNLAVQPTLSIRPGYLFNIILNQDIVLEKI